MSDDFKKKKRIEKNNGQTRMFFRTFLAAFIIITVIFTPIAFTLSKVAESNPGGEDAPVLAEELDVLVQPDSPFFDAFTNTQRVNILALGVTNEGLTDTIILASFDTEHKHVDLIWIPRDTYYYREGYKDDAQHKINAAYRKDPVNTAKAVSEILMNMPINYYAVLSYEGVAKIVDTMGGVPVNVPFHLYHRDPDIDIPEGQQILDGEHAVQFLRFRQGVEKVSRSYPDADLGRIKAQQEFMKSAFKQCLSFDLPKIVSTAYDNVISDIKLKTALSLVSKAAGITGDDITTYRMPESRVQYYVYPDAEKIAEMLTEIYSYGTEPEESENENGETDGTEGENEGESVR